jgi:hypothetical protein
MQAILRGIGPSHANDDVVIRIECLELRGFDAAECKRNGHLRSGRPGGLVVDAVQSNGRARRIRDRNEDTFVPEVIGLPVIITNEDLLELTR